MYKTKDDLNRVIENNKIESVIKAFWISYTKGIRLKEYEDKIRRGNSLLLELPEVIDEEEIVEPIINTGIENEIVLKDNIEERISYTLKEFEVTLDSLDLTEEFLKYWKPIKKEKLLREIEVITTHQTNNAYNMIAGREVSNAQRKIYESKGWLAEVVSRRNPKKLEELSSIRKQSIDEIVEEAKNDFETPYLEHVKEYGDKAFTPIEAYANYIVDVGIFWKKAEGSILNDIGAVKNKLLKMVLLDRMDEAIQMLPSIKSLKATNDASTPSEKLTSIRLQVKKLLTKD